MEVWISASSIPNNYTLCCHMQYVFFKLTASVIRSREVKAKTVTKIFIIARSVSDNNIYITTVDYNY